MCATDLDPTRTLAVVVVVATLVVLLAVTQLSAGPRQVTVGTVVISSALVVGSIALPALVLSAWQDSQ